MSRQELKNLLSNTAAEATKLRDDLETGFERRKQKWKKSSPNRRLLAANFRDRLASVDEAIAATQKAIKKL